MITNSVNTHKLLRTYVNDVFHLSVQRMNEYLWKHCNCKHYFFTNSLSALDDEGPMLQGVRCDKLELIAYAVQKKMEDMGVTLESVLDGGMLSLQDIFPFLPYLPEKLCSELSAEMV